MTSTSTQLVEADLNERQRKFALEYFGGENRGNGTKAYMAAYPDCSYSAASAAAHELLKHPKVNEFLARLQEEAREEVINEVRPWMELAPEAQAVVLLTVRGEQRKRLAFDAAKEVLDRAFGKPTERVEHQLRDEKRVARALMAIQTRIAHDRG